MAISVVPVIYDAVTKKIKKWFILDFETQRSDGADMLVIFDPATNLVHRIVVPGPGESIHPSHIQAGETYRMLPTIENFNPFDRDALATALAAHGLILP